ncbi:2-dehydro-3-deoxygalactonokinase [Defluviimonas sp. WL0050]|uniref:2-dehydro-3-deoxygalactonokinase n=1 Tax=Albidovulum litorale TaxID=2984134 RepID=A0ABT2ZNH4_9RHOB|nr:2-dehydro-3-deoxygalactonokinase [Defluviimonas sp. WL0050]MCV2872679.1 2-dehydro-3-deoxygalactonokinase [Defluviimonas sp. WL0050]
MSGDIAWIGLDWGTTHLRAMLVGKPGEVLHELASADGVATLGPDGFEPALLALIGPYLPPSGSVTMIACGMVGSSIGWREAPYRPVPCAPLDAAAAATVPVNDPRLSLKILPGLSQSNPPDVMRGEETQIAGFLATHPGWDGILCLPGTHSKWVEVSAGEVVSFQTFMTGELFALIGGQSVLRHTVATDGWDEAAFAEGLDDALARPERLATHLFRLRAAGILEGLDGHAARARLSGLLIGAELAAAKPYWLGRQVAILGAETVASAYHTALAAQGLAAEVVAGRDAVFAGLTAAASELAGRRA